MTKRLSLLLIALLAAGGLASAQESGIAGLMRLDVEGPKSLTVDVMTGDPEGWWRDIRRALGKSTRLEDVHEYWMDEAREEVEAQM